MTTTIPSAIVLGCLLLASCAGPSVSRPTIVDTAAGYRKTAYLAMDPHHSRVLQQKIFVGRAQTEPSSQSVTVDDRAVSKRAVPLIGTERIREGVAVRIDHQVDFRRGPISWNESVSAGASFVTTKRAILRENGVPACIHVGELITASYEFIPRPIAESSAALRPSPVSRLSCLQLKSSKTTRSGVTMQLLGVCEGLVSLDTRISARPGIKVPGARNILITKSPPLPANPSVVVGDIVIPEDPDPGVTEKERFVTLNWGVTSGMMATQIKIFQGANSVEELTVGTGRNTYKTSLIAGKKYRAELRAKSPGCLAEGDWSKPSIFSINVPN